MLLTIILAFLTGLAVKFVTGIDDMLIHVPVAAGFAKTHFGRLAFAAGIFVSVITVLAAASFLSEIFAKQPSLDLLLASALLLLAAAVYFDIGVYATKARAGFELKALKRIGAIHFTKLAALGFATFFVTAIDDIFAYTAVLIDPVMRPFVMAGILAAAALELALIISASAIIARLPYKKEIATIGLVVLALATALRLF